jgi:hypothetical protein
MQVGKNVSLTPLSYFYFWPVKIATGGPFPKQQFEVKIILIDVLGIG